jgi:hypothetical protein
VKINEKERYSNSIFLFVNIKKIKFADIERKIKAVGSTISKE